MIRLNLFTQGTLEHDSTVPVTKMEDATSHQHTGLSVKQNEFLRKNPCIYGCAPPEDATDAVWICEVLFFLSECTLFSSPPIPWWNACSGGTSRVRIPPGADGFHLYQL